VINQAIIMMALQWQKAGRQQEAGVMAGNDEHQVKINRWRAGMAETNGKGESPASSKVEGRAEDNGDRGEGEGGVINEEGEERAANQKK